MKHRILLSMWQTRPTWNVISYLTTQLIDMNVRMVMALNMYDELEASGNTLDYMKLSELFGVPMVPTVSRTGKGIEDLFHVVISIYEGGDFLSQKRAKYVLKFWKI